MKPQKREVTVDSRPMPTTEGEERGGGEGGRWGEGMGWEREHRERGRGLEEGMKVVRLY